MVEFKLKTLASQDTSIDQSNPDMYDGGSGYILVGDKVEPKLGLFRFPIAEKPTYGDAVLKYGSLGFYNISTSSNSGSNLPAFSIYKMKTSADGLDWGAGGTIHPVKRGKVITEASTSTNKITVEEHQLRTGEPISYTPFVRFYGDAVLTGIDREVEYYAIRIDDNVLQFAETAALAIAGTPISITTATPVVYKNPLISPPINENRYGYLRARKYRSDIHIVSSWGNNYESLVENFDGSQRRESELDFQSIQRNVILRDKQHLTNDTKDFADQIHATKSEDSSPNCTHSESSLKGDYATTVDGKKKMYLSSHQTNSDGGGWWGLKKSGKKSPSHYVRKRKPFKSATPNSDVKYEGETLVGTDRYGDEVTPMNSIFHTVRGAEEFQEASETEEGTNVLQATGAIRFSSEKKLTGGQSCNFYHFWKYQGQGVAYTAANGGASAKFAELFKGQECMVQYKNLPCPPVTMNAGIPLEYVGYEGPGQLPLGDGTKNSEDKNKAYDGQTQSLKLTMNISKLAKAFSTPQVPNGGSTIAADVDDIILSRRGMFVCLSAEPVGKGETLYEFITRLGGKGAATDYNSNTNWTTHKPIAHTRQVAGTIQDNTTGNISAIGFWIMNTSLGLQVIPLRGNLNDSTTTPDTYFETIIDRTNEEFYVRSLHNSDASEADILDHNELIGTTLGVDEWADWIIRMSPITRNPHLHIVSRDGFELLPCSQDTAETKEKQGLELVNIKEDRIKFALNITEADPAVVTSTSPTNHGLVNGDCVIYEPGVSISGETDLLDLTVGGTALIASSGRRFYAERKTDTEFYLHNEATTAAIADASGRLECTDTGTLSTQFFRKDDVGRLGHDPSHWTKNLSIWTFNAMSNYKTNATPGKPDDWMHGDDNSDMETSIFLDSISINGFNVQHQNNTLSDDLGSSTLKIAGGDTTNATFSGEGENFGTTYTANSSMEKIEKKSDAIISLGFEDPSQISSEHLCKKSWRYLYWQGYTSSNLTSDGPVSWTAGGTLPADTYLDDNDTDKEEQKWFSGIDTHSPYTDNRFDTAYSDTTWVHDAGSPFTYSPNWSRLKTTAATAPSWSVSYSDGHVSLGAQFSNEALHHRNLYYNRTTVAVANEEAGGGGTGQRMFTTSPGIGVTFRPVTDVTANVITIITGSFGTAEHNWNTGHKVVYYNNGFNSLELGAESGGGTVESVSNTFRDTPTAYYIVRTDVNKFKLATSYANAIANTTLVLGGPDNDENHVFYNYDYYVNKKYWINGWESKGFSRFILQPTQSDTVALVKPNYIDNLGEGGGTGDSTHSFTDVETDETTLYLTKRENMQCSAKVIEVVDSPPTSGSSLKIGTVTLKIDTTEPLYSTVGTTYRAYLVAKGSITPGTAAEGGTCLGEGGISSGATTGGDTISYASGLTINFVDTDIIEINNWNGFSGDGADTTNLLSDDNLPSLWISPEKYWVYFKITNRTGDTVDTFRTLPNKTYSAVCVVSPYGGDSTTWADNDAWGIPGATFNESVANFDTIGSIASAYVNQWQPQPSLKASETIFDLQDYGFGAPADAKDEDKSAFNGIRGGQAASFVPRDNQINMINMLKIFSTGEKKVEGDYLDLAISTEDEAIDSTIVISSTDNVSLPKPFLLTVFEDAIPANPKEFKVVPYEKDAFFPEFRWAASDGDLWYGFIIIDDMPISSQYHRSILHVPLNEDLRNTASSYDDIKGWYYADSSSPVVYGYRYYNTSLVDSDRRPLNKLDASTWSTNFALSGGGAVKVEADEVKIYDNVEGLAGNTKYFDKDGGSYLEFPFSATVAVNSAFTYPRDEMSVLAHITPISWADSGERAYIASFNESTDTTANFDAWGIYMDDEGRVNAFVGTEPDTTTPNDNGTEHIQLKSTTKMPIDGSPTCIILTIDTQILSGNVKLFINGRLEDQSGLRGTLSTNNWPTDSSGMGGDAIFFDIDSTTCALFIGAKAQDGSQVGQSPFNGKIEEFVWYDKVIYPVTPQDGKFVLEKPLEELVSGSANSSSKSHTARLFIKDYHNIRGKTTGEVAASSQLSFKKAAFELNTVVV